MSKIAAAAAAGSYLSGRCRTESMCASVFSYLPSAVDMRAVEM